MSSLCAARGAPFAARRSASASTSASTSFGSPAAKSRSWLRPRSRASFARAVAARHHRARLSARPRAMPSRDGGDSLDDEFAVAETDPRSTAAPDEEDDEEEEENETRVFRDAGMEANNDIAARFKNMLGYIFVARCGSEMPIGHFRLPADASVGANVFSEFVSSIVPAGADALTVAAQGIPRGVPYFHVGIGPFIAASIAMQVLVAVVPSLKELTKDQVGQHTVKQYTRYLTFVVAVVQSILAAAELRPYATLAPGTPYYLTVVPIFITGAVIVAWLADEMTNYGLGQGSSVMITMSVCGAYLSALQYYWSALAAMSFAQIAPWCLAAVVLIAGSVLVQTGTCKVPLLYFQGPSIPGLPKVVRADVDNVPFKINPLGMQPVLVAVFLCEGMMWLVKNAGAPGPVADAVAFVFSSTLGTPAYYLVFFLVVFGFSYLDLQDTPKDVSEYLVKIGARVPDVRPGEQTVRHLGQLQDGARFFGGSLLGLVAVACAAADNYTRAAAGVSIGFTSMLIVTSTILQIKRQVTAMSQMPRLDKVIDAL